MYANDTTPAAEGMTVTLTGLRDGKEYIIEGATDNRGHVDFGEVANGTYVLALDETGYNTYTVEVGGEIAAEYAFERALIATTNPNVDMSAADEGTIVYNANWCDEVVLRDIGGGEDFMISTVVSPFVLVDGAPSYANMGFYALIGDGNNTNDNGNSANQVRGGIQISGSNVILKFNGDWWESYTLPQEYADAFAAGTLRIGFGRGQGVFFLAAGIDDGSGECGMTRFVNLVLLTSDITKNAIDELHMFNNGTAQVTLSRILFETGEDVPEIGRVTFNGEWNNEMPIGRTDTENYNVAADEDFFIGGRVEGLLLDTSGNDAGERWLGFSVWQAGKWEGWWGTKNDTSGAHGALKDDGKGKIGLQWAGQDDGNWPWVDVPATREDLENGEVWFGFGRIDNKLFLCAWKEGGTKVFNIIPGDGSQMKKLNGALTLGKYAPNTSGTLLEVSFCTGEDVPALFVDAEYTFNTPENGSVEVTSPSVAVGSELKIVATPESGYRVETLTINGIAYTLYSGVQTQLDGETLTVTIPVWNASRADIEAAFKPIDYIAVTGAEDAENGTVEVSDRIEVGGDLVIEATPAEGYSFASLTVNDKAYTEYAGYSIEYEGETAIITLPAWAEETAAIAVTFTQLPTAAVSFTITLTDALAAQPPVAEGTAVLLKSSRTGAVLEFVAGADGKVDCGTLAEGEYTLSLEESGYNTFTLSVGGELQPTYAFVRNTVEAGENVAVDGAKVTISADNADAEICRTAAAGENFMISATVSNYAASGTGDAVVGFYAFTGAGDIVGNTGSTVNKVQGGLYRKADGVYLQFVGSENSGVKLPEAYQTAFNEGTLRIALGRAQSVFFLAAAVGEGEYTRFVDAARVTSDLTRIGGFTLGLYNTGVAAVTLSDMVYQAGEGVPLKGYMAFIGEAAVEEIGYGRTVEANWNVSAGEDFYITGRVTGTFTNASNPENPTAGERKLGFAAWEKDKWENYWAQDADTSGVKGGIKDENDGVAGLEWQGGSWPWTALPEGGQDAYKNGELIFGFGRIDGNFFICAGTSEENMAFSILQTAGGKLSDKNLVIGKWCNDSYVRGALADVMFYTGEDVPVELPSA